LYLGAFWDKIKISARRINRALGHPVIFFPKKAAENPLRGGGLPTQRVMATLHGGEEGADRIEVYR
jgi:hypothetical protein